MTLVASELKERHNYRHVRVQLQQRLKPLRQKPVLTESRLTLAATTHTQTCFPLKKHRKKEFLTPLKNS